VTARVGTGWLQAQYQRRDGQRRYRWTLQDVAAKLVLDLPPYAMTVIPAQAGDTLLADTTARGLSVRLQGPDARVRQALELPVSSERQAHQARLDAILGGVSFARPGIAASHPVMQPQMPPSAAAAESPRP
jgi:hypothetical protein